MRSLSLKVRLLLVLTLALLPGVVLAAADAWHKLVLVSSMPGTAPTYSMLAAFDGARLELWSDIGMILLFSLMGLSALWVVAERWCLRPLKPIQAAAAAIAQGNLTPLRPSGPTPPEVAALTRDIFALGATISARETDLRTSLDLREHLLREIHHRVKNNLQMILSLLNLQADKIRSPRILRLFGDTQDRVLTMSILHQHLYERSDWSSVDFQAYIADLVGHLAARRNRRDKPAVRCSVEALVLPVGPDTAIPIGLIVTEAVSNAFVHAFANTVAPEIRVAAAEVDGNIVVTIDDNGSGLSDSLAFLKEKPSLGVTLMHGLAAQLGGSIKASQRPAGGTRVRLWFRKPPPMPKANSATLVRPH
jgi:two-component sensor histidine kinase/HAMP domain-containing protein